MLSVSPINSGAGAANYYEQLARTDYYANGGEPPGYYIGERAASLGLSGNVEKGELKAVFSGFDPKTGEALVNNAGDKHKAGWDCTFSAPKSMSIAWAVGDDETRKIIADAHAAGIAAGIKEIERLATCERFGADGVMRKEVAGGVVAMVYMHSTNRNGEINLHGHCLVANVGSDGRCIELDTKWKMYAGAACRAAEIAHLQKHGIAVERDGSSFRLPCIDKKLERELSSRRDEIVAKLKEKGMSGGAAAAVAALDTRNVKGEVDRTKLFEATNKLAAEYGISAETIRAAILPEEQEKAPMPDHEEMMNEVIKGQSTVTEMQLQTAIMQEAQCKIGVEEARAYIADLKESEQLIELRDDQGGILYTSKEMYEVERNLFDRAEAMSKEQTHALAPGALERAMVGRTPSEEQKKALDFVTGPERIACVQGVAGAGKSYMLAIANDAWTSSGYNVHGCALAGKAGDGLLKASGIESRTIAKNLILLDQGRMTLDAKSIVVVDEAGMVGSRQMERLQSHIDRAGAKLVVVGESCQLQPVDNGGAFRAQMDACGKYVEMTEIRRQQTAEEMKTGVLLDHGEGHEERQMVMNARAGHFDEVLQHLEKTDRLRVFETRDELNKVVAKEIAADLLAGKTSQGMVGTRVEVAAINDLARQAYKEAGALTGDDKAFKATYGNEQNGEEVVQVGRVFAGGDRIIFLKNDTKLGVMNGATGTVEKAKDGSLVVRLDDTASKGKDGKEDLATATRVTVNQADYSHVDHAYAYTVHKAQGISTGGGHFVPGHMTDRESAYVAMSRVRNCGADGVKMYVTKEQIADRAAFVAQLNRSRPKLTSAHFRQVDKLESKLSTEQERIAVADKTIAILEKQIAKEQLAISRRADNAVPKPEKEQQNARPIHDRYERADREQLARARAAAALCQRNDHQTAPGGAPESVERLRNLSSIDLVQGQGCQTPDRAPELLLQGHARENVGAGRESDRSLRRQGSRDREADRGNDQAVTSPRLGKLERQLAEAKEVKAKARDAVEVVTKKIEEKLRQPVTREEKKPDFPKLTPKNDRETVMRDADLAKKALESHKKGEKLPTDSKKLEKGIKKGLFSRVSDSEGRQFIVRTKDGRVFSKELNKPALRETTSRNLNHLLLTKSRYIEIDKKFMGVKIGTQMLKSGGTLKTEAAGKLREKLKNATRNNALARFATKPLDNALRRDEAWRKVGGFEATIAWTKMKMEQRAAEKAIVKSLQEKVKQAEKQAAPAKSPELKAEKQAPTISPKTQNLPQGARVPSEDPPGVAAAKALADRPVRAPEPRHEAPAPKHGRGMSM